MHPPLRVQLRILGERVEKKIISKWMRDVIILYIFFLLRCNQENIRQKFGHYDWSPLWIQCGSMFQRAKIECSAWLLLYRKFAATEMRTGQIHICAKIFSYFDWLHITDKEIWQITCFYFHFEYQYEVAYGHRRERNRRCLASIRKRSRPRPLSLLLSNIGQLHTSYIYIGFCLSNFFFPPRWNTRMN